MTLHDYYPTMRNDISIEDNNLYVQHSNLIKSKNYLEAVDLLNTNKQVDSLTASLLNSWEIKIVNLSKINNFYDPYIYSQTEPTEMGDKVVWQQEY